MGEAAIAGALADFGARRLAVLVGHDDRGLEPRIAPVPALELVLVGGERHGGAELVVLVALPGRRERIHDAPFDAVEIEMLLAHEVEIARRQSAAGRPGVAARRQRLALGIGKALDVAVALALPVGLQIVPPAIAEIGPQILERALGMDVAVDDADACAVWRRAAGCLTSMFIAPAPSKRVPGPRPLRPGCRTLDPHELPGAIRCRRDHRSRADCPPGSCDAARPACPPGRSRRRRTASAESPTRRAACRRNADDR